MADRDVLIKKMSALLQQRHVSRIGSRDQIFGRYLKLAPLILGYQDIVAIPPHVTASSLTFLSPFEAILNLSHRGEPKQSAPSLFQLHSVFLNDYHSSPLRYLRIVAGLPDFQQRKGIFRRWALWTSLATRYQIYPFILNYRFFVWVADQWLYSLAAFDSLRLRAHVPQTLPSVVGTILVKLSVAVRGARKMRWINCGYNQPLPWLSTMLSSERAASEEYGRRMSQAPVQVLAALSPKPLSNLIENLQSSVDKGLLPGIDADLLRVREYITQERSEGVSGEHRSSSASLHPSSPVMPLNPEQPDVCSPAVATPQPNHSQTSTLVDSDNHLLTATRLPAAHAENGVHEETPQNSLPNTAGPGSTLVQTPAI